MARLFQRYISLQIAPDPGADPAKVAAIRVSVKAKGFMAESKSAAFDKLRTLDLQRFGYKVWKFSDTQWGLVTNAQISQLQGPAEVEGKEFKDFRISFKVSKTSDDKPNKTTIQLYNPNPDTISSVQDRSAIVRLFAGYDVPIMLASGNPIKDGVNIERNGPDRVLQLEIHDGGYRLSNVRLDLNLSKNTKLTQALKAVSQESGLGLGFIDDVDDVDLPYGMRLEGSPAQVLNRIAQMSGADFSVQDGSIQVLKPGNDTGEPAVLFSTKNGNLLRVARKEKGRVEVTAMLEGSIRPGRRFVVQSEYINGIFKAIDVEHSGDNYDNNFTTRITAHPWVQAPPAAKAGVVATIKAKVVKAGRMFATRNEAFARANRIDFSFGNNTFIAKFSDKEWGLVTRAESEKLSARGIPIFDPGFQGPIQ